MNVKDMKAEKAKLEIELNDLKNKSGMLSNPEKQQIKNLVSKIEGREKEDGTIVKLLPNHSIDVIDIIDIKGSQSVTLLDVLKGTLKNSVVTDEEKDKIKNNENKIKAFDTLINA
jgi:hypothetical protein